LVSEIAVTLLDVDEREPRVRRELRRRGKVFDQSIEFFVSEHMDAGGKTAIEYRVRVRRERCGSVRRTGTRVPAGVGELQADVEIAVSIRAESFAMCGDEALTEVRKRAHIRGR